MLVLVYLEIVLVSVQDTCMVCATCTIGLESFWTQPIVLLGDEAHVEYLVSVNLEIVLILTQDRCTVCAKRTIGSEIILDPPVGLRRTYHRLGHRFGRTRRSS